MVVYRSDGLARTSGTLLGHPVFITRLGKQRLLFWAVSAYSVGTAAVRPARRVQLLLMPAGPGALAGDVIPAGCRQLRQAGQPYARISFSSGSGGTGR